MIKSHISAVNAPIKIYVLQEQYQTASHAFSVVDILVSKIKILVNEKEYILIMVKTMQYSFEWSPEETLNMTERNSGTWDNEEISISYEIK